MENDTVRSEKEQLEVAKAAETSSIPPHHSFTICCTPDTVAEGWDGVWTEEPKLYEKLWSLEKFYDEPRYDSGEVIPTEHLFPDSLYRLNTVAGFWDKFTDEEKILLNKLAHRERGE